MFLLCIAFVFSGCVGNSAFNISDGAPMELSALDAEEYIKLNGYTGIDIVRTEGEGRDLAVWREITSRAEVISLPQAQVDYYYQSQRKEYVYLAGLYGIKYERVLEIYELTDEVLLEKARELTKKDLVFYAVLQSAGIALTDEEFEKNLDKYVTKISSVQRLPEEYVKTNMCDSIRETMLYDKASEFLIANNNFVN